MEAVLVTLIAFGIVFGIGAAIEQARRPRMLHADDQLGEGNTRR